MWKGIQEGWYLIALQWFGFFVVGLYLVIVTTTTTTAATTTTTTTTCLE
jgi:hypothetical protein